MFDAKQCLALQGFCNEGGLKIRLQHPHKQTHKDRKKNWTNTTGLTDARANCGETLQSASLRRVEKGKEKERGVRRRRKSKSKADGLHRGRTRETLRAVVK